MIELERGASAVSVDIADLPKDEFDASLGLSLSLTEGDSLLLFRNQDVLYPSRPFECRFQLPLLRLLVSGWGCGCENSENDIRRLPDSSLPRLEWVCEPDSVG